jgi:hypothetical protein
LERIGPRSITESPVVKVFAKSIDQLLALLPDREIEVAPCHHLCALPFEIDAYVLKIP